MYATAIARRTHLALVLAAGAVLMAPATQARITEIQITATESPTRLLVAGRRSVREDRRQGVRRGQSA